ncbi:hypothetical protein RRG08_017090 [Elysia crispata]|uniref:Major facilitator superfamily (MFS) profile domain-containing protein n=1 Tax=Elysia crispata TaxID=231223 RepID=A0AAE0YGI5_9GAST|nr:hypothetical protein RRG08_017090 [Elysia crispata]
MTEIEKVALFPSQRFAVAFLVFLGNVFNYVTRVNLSVAVVCMVRSRNTNNTIGSFDSISNTTTSPRAGGGACGGGGASTGSSVENRGEFDWDKTEVGQLLAMYFYGYIFLQLPSGWLASRYGGKRVWGVCQTVCAVCTLLTPVCARTSIHLAYAARFILGFAAGVNFPCVHSLLGRWSPPLERSKLASIAYSGRLIGNILAFSISGLLCEYGFDNGWASIFYISGIGYLLWVVAWFWFAADSPDQHKYISERERIYITSSIGKGGIKRVRHTPWLAMLRSVPLWAILIAHSCSNYTNYTLLTSLPTFMKESLNFDIKANGALTALPYIFQFLTALVVGQVADRIRERRVMSTKNVRKLFQSISLVGAGLFVSIMGLMGCEERYVAIAMLCLGFTLYSASIAGYLCNHLDLAPSYAGLLLGITNTMATVPGIIAPTIAGILTPEGTAQEWRNVFYLCTAVAFLGMLLFAFMADGKLQDWAVQPEVNLQLEIEGSNVRDTRGDTALMGSEKDMI